MTKLIRAPADRSWRRRGMLVLCRAYPDRVRRLAVYAKPSGGECDQSKQQSNGVDDDGGDRDANARGAGWGGSELAMVETFYEQLRGWRRGFSVSS